MESEKLNLRIQEKKIRASQDKVRAQNQTLEQKKKIKASQDKAREEWRKKKRATELYHNENRRERSPSSHKGLHNHRLHGWEHHLLQRHRSGTETPHFHCTKTMLEHTITTTTPTKLSERREKKKGETLWRMREQRTQTERWKILRLVRLGLFVAKPRVWSG